MEYAAVILASAARQLQLVFETDENLEYTNPEQLQHQVSKMVHYLLLKDLSRLLHILYRIDVEEQQVKKALRLTSEDEVANEIARLIIKRELQKAQTRFIYSQNAGKPS